MVKFLYQGQIDCSVELDFVKILKNLKDIFGFPEKFHEECFKDYGVATSKKCFPRETNDNCSSTEKSNMSSKDSIFIQDPNGTQLKMKKLFKDNDILLFTETWLNEQININVEGFTPYPLHRKEKKERYLVEGQRL